MAFYTILGVIGVETLIVLGIFKAAELIESHNKPTKKK